jgi:hypothetical protein
MAKKTYQTYTATEIRAINERLADHKAKLIAEIQTALKGVIDQESACHVRDMAQFLATTCLVLENEATLKLAEMSGEPKIIPYLKDTGLDAPADEL